MVLPIDSVNFNRILRTNSSPVHNRITVAPSFSAPSNPFINEGGIDSSTGLGTDLSSQIFNFSNVVNSSNIVSQQAAATQLPSDIVTGADFDQAVSEIEKQANTFSHAVTSKNFSSDNNTFTFNNIKTYDNGLSIAGADSKIDFETARNIAAMKASFNFDVSDKTKEAVSKLNLQHVQVQAQTQTPPYAANMAKIMDGMIPFASLAAANPTVQGETPGSGKNFLLMAAEALKNAHFDPHQSTSNPFLGGGETENSEKENKKQGKGKNKFENPLDFDLG